MTALEEKYAKEHNIPRAVFPARWKQYGKNAGPLRNTEMIDYAAKQESVVITRYSYEYKREVNISSKTAEDA